MSSPISNRTPIYSFSDSLSESKYANASRSKSDAGLSIVQEIKQNQSQESIKEIFYNKISKSDRENLNSPSNKTETINCNKKHLSAVSTDEASKPFDMLSEAIKNQSRELKNKKINNLDKESFSSSNVTKKTSSKKNSRHTQADSGIKAKVKDEKITVVKKATSKKEIEENPYTMKIVRRMFVDPHNAELLFFKNIKKLSELKKGEITIAYTYPFFTTERELIKFLSDFKSSAFTERFLTSLALEMFPNGIPNLLEAKDHLDQLTKKLKITSPIFNSKALKGFSKENPVLPKAKEAIWKVNEIADAITERDARIMEAITFREISLLLQNKEKADSIKKLEDVFQRTVNWIAYQIVKDENMYGVGIDKAYDLGCEFLERGNLQGVMYVAEALSKDSISRLNIHDVDYQEFANIRLPADNFYKYRRVEKSVKEITLPATFILFKDMQDICSKIEKSKKPIKDFEELANYAQLFKKARTIGSEGEPSNGLKFLSNLDYISDKKIWKQSLRCKSLNDASKPMIIEKKKVDSSK